jgi:small subunit ribosomal protein S19e
VSKKLKDGGKIKPPQWAPFVKMGIHRERSPSQDDWWFIRCASILRRIYLDGPVGTSRLRTYYGGRQRRGVTTPRFAKGSGSIIREALQQLEKAGYLKRSSKGRMLSPKGRSFIDNLAYEISKNV